MVHGVSENSLAGFKEADGIALGIREPRERASRNGDGCYQRFPAERSRSVEISLKVIDLNVNNRVTVGLAAESRDVEKCNKSRKKLPSGSEARLEHAVYVGALRGSG